jgi:hypothetical protein
MEIYPGPISGYYGGTTGYAGVSGICGSSGICGYSSSSTMSSGLTYATLNSTNELPILLEDFKIIELKKTKRTHFYV